MGKSIGIAVGGTTLSVAVIDAPGRPGASIVPDADGTRSMAAVVAFPAAAEPVCGAAAQRLAQTRPDEVLAEVFARVTLDGDLRLRDAAAALFARARANAASLLGEEPSAAVIAVPADCPDARGRAIVAAAKRAGFAEVSLMEAPIAAAIAGAAEKDERLAVYDLGGRTFAAAIVEIADGAARVRASAAASVGGAEFDARVADMLAARFEKDHGIDPRRDPKSLARLLDAAREARHELSSWIEAEVNLPFLAADGAGAPLHLVGTLTRADVEIATSDLLDRAAEACARALRDAKVAGADVAAVLVAGGMGRAAAVQRAASEAFGAAVRESFAPDEILACGAALRATQLPAPRPLTSHPPSAGSSLRPTVAPIAIGLETGEGAVTVVVPRGAPLPASRTLVFTTAIDHQPFVPVHVVAGPRPHAADDRTLVRFDLGGVAPGPRGAARIAITIHVAVDGTVDVEATDRASGRTHRAQAAGAFSDPGARFDDAGEDDAQPIVRHAPDASLMELRGNSVALLYLVDEATPGCAGLVDDQLVAHAATLALELRVALETGADLATLRGAYDRLDAVALTIGRSLFDRSAPA